MQGYSCQVGSGHVTSVCINIKQLKVSGGISSPSPEKVVEFGGYEITSETIFRPKWCCFEVKQ